MPYDTSWHEKARRARLAGLTYKEIAKQLGKHFNTVYLVLNPEYMARQRASEKAWCQNNPGRRDTNHRRARLRLDARREAAATGEHVYHIYARWGVLNEKDQPPCDPATSPAATSSPCTPTSSTSRRSATSGTGSTTRSSAPAPSAPRS